VKWLLTKIGLPKAIGLPARRTHFATRPIQIARGDLSPEVLLREALRSQNISVDNMVVDVLKAKPDERSVAAIVSCDRKYLTGLLSPLEALFTSSPCRRCSDFH